MPYRPFPGARPIHRSRAGYTVNLFLPFARLLLRTARPPLVAIRTRNPCVRFIFVLLKFVNVFFIVWSPVQINKFSHKPYRGSFVKANVANMAAA
jgi:hypothetical protein